jgi:membrane fusion protein, heavy metal efflux system
MKKTSIFLLMLSQFILAISCNKNEPSHVQSSDLVKDSTKKDAQTKNSVVELSEQKFKNSGIELGSINERNLKDVVKCNGILTLPPQNKANISSLVAGIVKDVFVIEGDFVKKGKVLADLVSPQAVQMQEAYIKAKDNLSFLEKEYQRQKELLNENVTSGKKFQQAEADYKTEKGRVNSLADQLLAIGLSPKHVGDGKTTILIPVIAPIDGYVRKININIGTFVETAKEMFEIVDLHHLHIDLQVFENDFPKIQIGQKVNVTLPHQENNIIQAEVFATGKAFENDSRSVTIHAEIKNNKNKSLIPGMYINAFIETGSQKVQAVPEEAVVSDGGKNYIFVFQDKRKEGDTELYHFRSIEVNTGITGEGFIEITQLEPTPENSQVVIKGAYYLLSEMKKEESGDH